MLDYLISSAMDAAANGSFPLPFLFLGMGVGVLILLMLYPLVIRPLRSQLRKKDKEK